MDVAGSKGPGRTLPSDGSALAGVEAAGGHDIDEAVYLGERVLILSSSPTVVREQLRVGLPRDRDQLHTRVTPVSPNCGPTCTSGSRRRNAGRPPTVW